MKIFNMQQADFLVKNNCKVIGVGLMGKVYIEFKGDKNFDDNMEKWRTRKS